MFQSAPTYQSLQSIDLLQYFDIKQYSHLQGAKQIYVTSNTPTLQQSMPLEEYAQLNYYIPVMHLDMRQ
jgi:hypothetical protein